MSRSRATMAGELGEITITHLLQDLRRWLVPLALFVALVTTAAYATGVLLPRKYTASVVMAAVEDSSAGGPLGGLGALASRYSGLASLAGVSVPGSAAKDETIAVLQSDLLTSRYVQDHNLLPVLFAKHWDAVTGRWTVAEDDRRHPSLWKANRLFEKRIRSVRKDKETGLVVLSIVWTDPGIAATWANELVALTNQYLRDKAVQESERNIAYLNEQAGKTSIVEGRQAIYALLQDELNRQMMARGRDDYALKVIDPAVAPEKPSSLGPLALAALGFFASSLLAVMALLGRRILGTAARAI